MTILQNQFDQPVGPPISDWTPRPSPSRVVLQGQYCRLEPVKAAIHGQDLFEAYDQATDARDWTYMSSGPFNDRAIYLDYAARLETSVDPMHYAVIDSGTGKAVGTLALMRIDPGNGVIEVGHVAFSPLLQRRPAATEAHYLLMRYAFELGYRRYEWKCDSLNARSRRAAQRLGFSFEGIFRQAIVYKGRSRDTAWFSIIDSEWPARRAAFETWLAPANFDEHGQQRQTLASKPAI